MPNRSSDLLKGFFDFFIGEEVRERARLSILDLVGDLCITLAEAEKSPLPAETFA